MEKNTPKKKNDFFVSPETPKFFDHFEFELNEPQKEKQKQIKENKNLDNFLLPDNKDINKDNISTNKTSKFLGKKRIFKVVSREDIDEIGKIKTGIDILGEGDYEEDDEKEMKENNMKKEKEKTKKRKRLVKSSDIPLSEIKINKKNKESEEGLRTPQKVPKKIMENYTPEPNIENIRNNKNIMHQSDPIGIEDDFNDALSKKENERDNNSEKILNNSFSIFNEENLKYNNDISNNFLCNIDTNNSSVGQFEDDSKSIENYQYDKNIIKVQYKDEKFINFEKDLRDYLRRIMSFKREKKFLKSILPQSVEIMKKLFVKNNNISPDTVFPIYNNDFLEISLSIEKGGLIRKKISMINP